MSWCGQLRRGASGLPPVFPISPLLLTFVLRHMDVLFVTPTASSRSLEVSIQRHPTIAVDSMNPISPLGTSQLRDVLLSNDSGPLFRCDVCGLGPLLQHRVVAHPRKMRSPFPLSDIGSSSSSAHTPSANKPTRCVPLWSRLVSLKMLC